MWDVFCRVIDNHGDLGVCLRLSRQLAAQGQSVRLWVDEPSALAWMAPELATGHMPGVQLRPWAQASEPAALAALAPATVWVEAFACELPEPFVAHGVAQRQALGLKPPAWINLEYLSAEPWVERAHALPSPVMSGPARGWVKRFFYPGFTPRTGGVLRESDLLSQQAGFDRAAHRAQLLGRRGSDTPPQADKRLISLFCYEPDGLTDLLRGWSASDRLLITPGRALAAVRAAWDRVKPEPKRSEDHMPPWGHPLSHTDQPGFDRLLWACDLNLVRGEDSLVRALWAGQPLVWHIYPQSDDAHHAKLTAFLDWLQAPQSLRHFSRAWNGMAPGQLPDISASTLAEWGECVRQARQRLLTQDDLLTQLLAMVGGGRGDRD
jgi:uncharacterized repeat protein (TIGR03837 family)